jgi:serine/threonine protein kinase
MLTGRLPYIGSNRMEVAYATVNSPIPSAVKINPKLPDELDALLTRVLAKEPGDRPQTVKDVLAQMAKLPQRRSSPVGAPPPPVPAAASSGGVAVLPRPAVASNGPDTTSMRAIPSPHPAPPPVILHGSPPPTPSSAAGSTIRTLELMGVRPARARGRFILNSYFSNQVHVARDVTGDRTISCRRRSSRCRV